MSDMEARKEIRDYDWSSMKRMSILCMT